MGVEQLHSPRRPRSMSELWGRDESQDSAAVSEYYYPFYPSSPLAALSPQPRKAALALPPSQQIPSRCQRSSASASSPAIPTLCLLFRVQRKPSTDRHQCWVYSQRGTSPPARSDLPTKKVSVTRLKHSPGGNQCPLHSGGFFPLSTDVGSGVQVSPMSVRKGRV